MTANPAPTTLIHYTGSATSMLSILQFGFLAAANSTELLDLVAEGRVLPENTIPGGGVICFSEPNGENSGELRKEFGRFGVAIDGGAFRNHAIHKVTYLNPKGPTIGRLRRAFEELAPSDLHVVGAASSSSKVGLSSPESILPAVRSAMVATGLGIPSLHPDDPFLRLIRRLKYCQTSFHRWEREWRLTGPVGLWIPTSVMDIDEAKRARKQSELQILRGVHQRSLQAGFISSADRKHLMTLSFCPEPRHIRWIEAPAAKVDSIRRKLRGMIDVWGWPCGGIEVRPI